MQPRSLAFQLAVSGIAVWAGCSEPAAPGEFLEPGMSYEDEGPLVDPDLPPLEAGRILYGMLECAGCHESAAVPGLVVIPLRGLSERFTDASLAAYLTAPAPPMPDFMLDERERRALAVYLRATFSAITE
jgi:mono/diheme cytochrome c family protein